MTSKGVAEVSWTTARLVPEALGLGFHALEDDDMIKWWGKAAFVDTYINGILGWQDKVRHCVFSLFGFRIVSWFRVLSHSSSIFEV
jgi:hypothetical protein